MEILGVIATYAVIYIITILPIVGVAFFFRKRVEPWAWWILCMLGWLVAFPISIVPGHGLGIPFPTYIGIPFWLSGTETYLSPITIFVWVAAGIFIALTTRSRPTR
jgi:hypothetical protein